jgi:predicted AlkP superfamily phosphohydrolase/phosphomutase
VRTLVLGLDGGDHELISSLVKEGRMPTLGRLAREGTFGPLESTIPAVTPTAWSSFLTGLNPAGHGIFNFASNPNRDTQRVESAASRSGTPIWRYLGRAGLRSAFVGIPFTYPPEDIAGLVVTGYGGPEQPAITPPRMRERVHAAHPGYLTAHHPMAERWWEDFDGYARKLLRHVEQTADICRIALELEPDLALLCVNFMSADHAGHLGYNRLDENHPAHDPAAAGDELIQVYEAVDRACGELIDEAEERYGEPITAIMLSDHGMKPIYWTFHANHWLEENGHLQYRRRSLQGWKGSRLDYASKVDQRLARTTRWYGGVLDTVPGLPRPGRDRVFADVDFSTTRAYCFATGGQIFLGETSGARDDPRYADRLSEELGAIPHPETGEPVFEVMRRDEIYAGPHIAKAPDLVILPRDERVHVESSRRSWAAALERHDHLDPETFYGYSGHHGQTGVFAAAGPGIRPAELPKGANIVQLPATLLALAGLTAPDMDGEPLHAVLELDDAAEVTLSAPAGAGHASESAYSADEEAEIVERLRDLGYE